MLIKKTVRNTLLGLAVAAALITSASAASPVRMSQNANSGVPLWQVCLRHSAGRAQSVPAISADADAEETLETEGTEEVPTASASQDAAQTSASTADTTASAASSISAYEQEVVDLVNEIRAQYGLQALEISETLCDGARLKSQDMRDNGYFDHTSPTYGTPFEMMRALGISYSAAGENIAMGQSTPEAVVNAWMNSEGHRANILSTSYTQIGVGYVADGSYWTQWFIG